MITMSCPPGVCGVVWCGVVCQMGTMFRPWAAKAEVSRPGTKWKGKLAREREREDRTLARSFAGRMGQTRRDLLKKKTVVASSSSASSVGSGAGGAALSSATAARVDSRRASRRSASSRHSSDSYNRGGSHSRSRSRSRGTAGSPTLLDEAPPPPSLMQPRQQPQQEPQSQQEPQPQQDPHQHQHHQHQHAPVEGGGVGVGDGAGGEDMHAARADEVSAEPTNSTPSPPQLVPPVLPFPGSADAGTISLPQVMPEPAGAKTARSFESRG